MRDVNTNYKKSTITLLIVLLALFTGGTAGILHAINAREQTPSKTSAATTATMPKVQAATIIRFTAVKDKTVLEQLKAMERVVVNQDPTYGAFVESINGVKNGGENKYWSYYVNGQMANIGAGNYKTAGGEEIVWKFE